MIYTRACSLWLLILAATTVLADQRDPRLDELFESLQEIREPEALQRVESEIWGIWLQSEQDGIDTLMRQGINAMHRRDLDTALARFDEITEQAPEFAEGWNKRATVYYLRGELEESVKDIQRTLALEPRHFGALSGMGLIFMKLGDTAGALEAFQGVLEIHPHSPSAQAHIQNLRQQLKDDVI